MNSYIDMHCDTLSMAAKDGLQDIYAVPDYMADVERLRQAGCMAQFFAIFMPPSDPRFAWKETSENDAYIEWCLEIFQKTLNAHPEAVGLATSYESMQQCTKEGKLAGFLTLEDGRGVEKSIEKLETFYEKGIRLISLTWNHHNCFGAPNSWDPQIMAEGLTPFGKEAVVRMQELGMLVDVSHLSDGGFWDVVNLSKQPFVASHSNCRQLNLHPRSMSDEMIRALAEKGGVMGVNFFSSFLHADVTRKDSTVEAIVAHLRHMIQVGGMECAAIGTDFDGMHCQLEIGTCTQMERLFQALEQAHFTATEIEHITTKNTMRVIRDACKG